MEALSDVMETYSRSQDRRDWPSEAMSMNRRVREAMRSKLEGRTNTVADPGRERETGRSMPLRPAESENPQLPVSGAAEIDREVTERPSLEANRRDEEAGRDEDEQVCATQSPMCSGLASPFAALRFSSHNEPERGGQTECGLADGVVGVSAGAGAGENMCAAVVGETTLAGDRGGVLPSVDEYASSAQHADGTDGNGASALDHASPDSTLARDATNAAPAWSPNGGQLPTAEAHVPQAPVPQRRETRLSRQAPPVLLDDDVGFTFNFSGLNGQPSATVKLDTSALRPNVHIATEDAGLFSALIEGSDRLDSEVRIDGEESAVLPHGHSAS
ncbi:protein of unknown function [Pararobbsia alpina]|uniref:hypothetical protein n=1 Tax=Pararobbsia alpina TaxID=621374 RepID=UPI0039A5DB55